MKKNYQSKILHKNRIMIIWTQILNNILNKIRLFVFRIGYKVSDVRDKQVQVTKYNEKCTNY